MRCHAAEPGAVTSTTFRVSQTPRAGVPGGPSAARKGRCQGAERRGSTDRTQGRGRKSRLDHGCESTQVRFGRTARYRQNTVVERRLARRPDRKGRRLTLRKVSTLKARHPALRSLSPVRESEERDRRCAPASVERGGGALAVFPLPSGERVPSGARRVRVKPDISRTPSHRI